MILLVLARVMPYYVQRTNSLDRVWNPALSPYPGLDPFTSDDAAIFFGREQESHEILERLADSPAEPSGRLLLIIGASGIGKSSLLHAGVLPMLNRVHRHWEVIGVFRPSTNPITRMYAAVSDRLGVPPPDEQDPLAVLTDRAARAKPGRPVEARMLVVDQMEEIFTLNSAEQRDEFLRLLERSLEADPGLHVVGILRSEFLTDMLTGPIASLVRQPITVGPMDRKGLFQAIEGPAKYVGLEFEPGLVSRMVDDARSGDALPLLAYVLQELYLKSGRDSEITQALYLDMGGVSGALAKRADRILASFGEDRSTFVIDVMLSFVTIDGREPARRLVRRAQLSGEAADVVGAFVANRILTTLSIGSDAFIGVSHEALFRAWAPLRQAIEIRTDYLRRRGQVERWAAEWEAAGRQPAYLLSGERLAFTQQWLSSVSTPEKGHEFDGSVDSLTMEYLEISYRADRTAMERLADSVAAHAMASLKEDPEKSLLLALAAVEEIAPTAQAYRALWAAVHASRLRGVLKGHTDWVFSAAWSPRTDVVATGSRDGEIKVWEQKNQYQPQRLGRHNDWVLGVAWNATGTLLVSCSRDQTLRLWHIGGFHLLKSVSLGSPSRCVEWDHRHHEIVVGTDDGLVRIFDEDLHEVRRFAAHDKEVRAISSSVLGDIAVGLADGSVVVLDREDGRVVRRITHHTDWIHCVAWSPDGAALLIGSRDRSTTLWSAPTWRMTGSLTHLGEEVRCATWSPDGRQILFGLHDGTGRVWTHNLSRELSVLQGHEDWIRCAAWSRDGNLIVTGSQDHTVRLWSPFAEDDGFLIDTASGWVHAISWAPDCSMLASGSSDSRVRIWRMTGDLVTVLDEHQDDVVSLDWSRDGGHLASASRDRTVTVWHAGTWTKVARLQGHTLDVLGVRWSPNSRWVASAGRDRRVCIWDTRDWTLSATLHGHTDEVLGVAWSADGQWLASGSRDRTVRIWRTDDWSQADQLPGHVDDVFAVCWSPSGEWLASGSRDRTIRIWRASTRQCEAVLSGHEDEVLSLSWSPDERWLVTGSRDRTWRIWASTDWHEFPVFGEHGDEIRSVVWSRQGDQLATAGRDSTIRFWRPILDLDALIRLAKTRTFRELSLTERELLLHEPFLPSLALPGSASA
ncbi:WD40 repeat domain-containing protein [Actinoplanes sp. NEAU-A12]|uniref:WD40 repeat domain-containing protein n=1 Tax=Actinoplanes sandaracinus TaxID=3045177 RepID=A0ABT6WBZ5_9ACTN|nr:WD40 repeat domain-containing protein [Actinoplanes sandaracinus]MDI6097202.1 WD40 repeat domain-containing protein [Actinoplanes sandaracinus]